MPLLGCSYSQARSDLARFFADLRIHQWVGSGQPVNQDPLKRRVGRPARYAPPQLIRDLRRQGLSFREIAQQTGFGYGTVRRAFLGVPTTSRASLAGAGQEDLPDLGTSSPTQVLAPSSPCPTASAS